MSQAAVRPTVQTDNSTGRARAWLTLALATVLIAAGAWAYQTSFAGAFVFDDFSAFVQNPNITSLWPLTRAMAAPQDTPLAGRPVASLTFAINYALSPPDARDSFEPTPVNNPTGGVPPAARNIWGYHLLNLVIHLAAGLALFGIVRRTLKTDRLRARLGSAATALSFAIALLWLVHPLQTEAVTYVVQRVESLMGLFVLLALYCSIRAARSTRPHLWTGAAILSAAIGVGSKEVAAVTPVLVIAWDRVFLAAPPDSMRRAPSVRRGRWPLYAGLVAAALLLVIVEPGARSKSVGLWLDGWTPWTYLLTESGVLVDYIRHAFWPSPLVLDPFWPKVSSISDVAMPMALLTMLVALTAIGLVRRNPLGFLGAWFFVILAPTSSVLPIVSEVGADRRMYLPLAAVVALAVVCAYELGRVVITRLCVDRLRRPVAVAAGAVLVAGLAFLLGTGTRARSLDYSSDESIWRDTIRKQPGNARARTALGANLLAAGRYQEAETELLKALTLDFSRAETLSNLGGAELMIGKLEASITHLEKAVALRPEYIDAHRNLAEAYRISRQDARAVAHFRLVLTARPNNTAVLNHFALILAVSSDDAVRDGAKALELASRAVSLTSRRDPISLGTLAAALAELERFDAAVAALQEALALSTGNPALTAELSGLRDAYAARQKVRRPSRS